MPRKVLFVAVLAVLVLELVPGPSDGTAEGNEAGESVEDNRDGHDNVLPTPAAGNDVCYYWVLIPWSVEKAQNMERRGIGYLVRTQVGCPPAAVSVRMDGQFAAALWGAVVGGAMSLLGSVGTTLFMDRKTQERTERGVLEQARKLLTAYVIAEDASKESHLTKDAQRLQERRRVELRDLAPVLTLKRHADIALTLYMTNGTEDAAHYEEVRRKVTESLNGRLAKRSAELRKIV